MESLIGELQDLLEEGTAVDDATLATLWKRFENIKGADGPEMAEEEQNELLDQYNKKIELLLKERKKLEWMQRLIRETLKI